MSLKNIKKNFQLWSTYDIMLISGVQQMSFDKFM